MCPIVVNNNRAKNATKIEKKSKLTNIPLVIHSWLTANQKSIGFLLNNSRDKSIIEFAQNPFSVDYRKTIYLNIFKHF